MKGKTEKGRRIRRPNRPLLVLMCVIVAIVVVLNVLVIGFATPYFGVINTRMVGKPTTEEATKATQASSNMTETVEDDGIILLSNDGALPLGGNEKVNVFGAATEGFVYGGTGSGAGGSGDNVTFYQGLQNAGLTPNPELMSFYQDNVQSGVDMGLVGTDYNNYELSQTSYSQQLVEDAKSYSDVAVVLISRKGGEGSDLPMDMAGYVGGQAGRSYLELTQDEEDLLSMARANFRQVVVVLNSPNAMELGFLKDQGVDAALWVGTPGSTGCNSVGGVLTGKVNPSGKTVDTFPYSASSAPSYYSFGDYTYNNVTYANGTLFAGTGDASSGGGNYHYVDYDEGIYVGYRYYETAAADGYIDYSSTVQYPFGYGLSYTTFDKKITGFADDGTTIKVDVTVTNTGSVAGKDVAEVYYSAPYTKGGIEKSSVVLGGFEKTDTLAPGASQTVSISFTHEDMASYDYTGVKAAGGAYVLEAGDYAINLQSDSHTVLDSRTVHVDADVIYNDANAGARSTDSAVASNRFDDVSNGDGITYVSRADWAGTMPTARAVQSKDATEAQIAAFKGEALDDSETTDITYANNGLKLADMKGLSYDDPKWNKLLEQLSVKDMTLLVGNGGWQTVAIDSIAKPHLSDCDGPNGINNIMAGVRGNQYTGQSVLGYTWNKGLAQAMGSTFGTEAAAYGISGLYAPGANIHRSPFGGRNYEYVSEDGLLTGKIVASEIKGIQSQGVFCYTKHFAANDQETNRDQGGLVTWVNEQALREVYLRGFELAVKEGGSQAMMSSFNRIGATPAAESRALLSGVLRDEWGFHGMVITDCVMACSTENPNRALRAGNDLQLTFLGQMQLTNETTGTAAGRQALRQASHNILYTIANSNALETATYGPYPFAIELGIADVAVIGLLVLYFVRRHLGMKRWRAAGKPKGRIAMAFAARRDRSETTSDDKGTGSSESSDR